MRFRPGQHLRRQSDIRAVRQSGQRVDCRAFTLWWLPREGETSPARACFVASIQAVGGATLRNLAKRRMREAFRRNQSRVPAGIDVMLVARASVLTWEFPRVEAVLCDAIARMSRASTPPTP